ncbi:MAG: molybdenum ABC transporter ATP-binding protein [Proteobacteria bacterium]|nr:molybdenum ABC transporter ATP-binding protein [Pseudomonadota bacterium]
MSKFGHFSLKLDRPAFKLAVNFDITEHSTLGIFGPSGCGKTSILRCIAGLEPQAQCEIKFNERLWQQGSSAYLPIENRHIAYVFQGSRLFPHLTVKQNLAFAQKRSAKNSGFSLNEAEIIDLLGIERLMGCMPENISGGEQQRVAIARALFSKPELLLFDEPMASLDDAMKTGLLPYLLETQNKTAIPMIYVSHQLSELVSICNEIMILDQGKSVYQGTMSDALLSTESGLLNTNAPRAILYGKVSSFDAKYKLSQVKTKCDNVLFVRHKLVSGDSLKIIIDANDVSLTLKKPEKTSILNVLEGKISSINQRSDFVTVGVDCGGEVILANISLKSFHQLEIKPEMPVQVQIKTVSVQAHLQGK